VSYANKVSTHPLQPQDLVESIKKVKMLETHVGMKQKQVANLKFDASSIAAVKQLKGDFCETEKPIYM